MQKDFPLETECNTGLARDIHLAACEAAAACKAAHAKGRGEAMEDWLYTNHATLTPASVRQAAAEIGGVTDFDAQYPALINTVKGDVALATILGVSRRRRSSSTASRSKGRCRAPYFELALQLELKKAGKTK